MRNGSFPIRPLPKLYIRVETFNKYGLFPLTKKPEFTHLNLSVSLYLYILALKMQEGRGWYRGVCRAVPIRVARRTDWTGRGSWDGGGRVEGLCLFMMVEVGGGSE